VPKFMDRQILVGSEIMFELLYISNNFNINFNKFKHKFMLFFGNYQSLREDDYDDDDDDEEPEELNQKQVNLIINFNISFYFMVSLFQFIKFFKPSFNEPEALMKVFEIFNSQDKAGFMKFLEKEIARNFTNKMMSFANISEKETELFQCFFLFELLYIFVDEEDFFNTLLEKFHLTELHKQVIQHNRIINQRFRNKNKQQYKSSQSSKFQKLGNSK
jgi:hypothetical protein